MEKSTVTRAFSIGATCSRNNVVQSEDLSTARRHSSSGIRALLWAASRTKSCGSSVGSETQTTRDNIFPNILTPDSIPQFTIPNLSLQSSLRSLEDNEETLETEEETPRPVSAACSSLSKSKSTSGLSLAPSDRKAERSVSDPLTHRRRSCLQNNLSFPSSHTEAQHCLDPASRAALSLPHLTKVTTPYGFVTLSQSPQMANEEVLLCQAGLRRLNKEEETTETPRTNADSGVLSKDKTRPSEYSANSQTKDRLTKDELQASTCISSTYSSSFPAPRQPDGRLKRGFYEVIMKHFSIGKESV